MSFLAPFFLLGALAIAGPVIYHLVRRTTREQVPFSSLIFLQPSPPRLSQRHRIEHLLLLLLRCLALAVLAFAFARPFLTRPPDDEPGAARPARTVILLDTSASMRREGVWPAAVARATDWIRKAGPADELAVMTFDRAVAALLAAEEWRRTAPGDRAALAAARVAAAQPGWGGTRLGAALAAAAETLADGDGKAAPGPRRIVLISDLQAGSRLEALQAYEWPKGVELALEPVAGSRPTNAGLQVMAEGAEAARPADAPVRVRVSNSADAKREQFKLGWAAGTGFSGEPVDAYVPPGQSRVFLLPRAKGAAGSAEVALAGDDEDFDNRAFAIAPVQQRPVVLWLGSDAAGDAKQPLFFLRRALVETPRAAVALTARAPAAIPAAAELGSASVILIGEAIDTAAASALRLQAEAGRTIVMVLRRADAATAAALGVLAGTAPPALTEGKSGGYAMLAEIDFRHPLLAPFADPRFSDFSKIRFWRHRRIDLAGLPGARVVAKFDSGDPALLEIPAGRGRTLVFAAGWHPEDSQLALSSKFAPLMWSLLETSGAIGDFVTQYNVGDPVALPPEAAGAVVTTPAGTAVAMEAGRLSFAGTDAPGIYRVAAAGKEWRFAVNLDPAESRTAPLSTEELEQQGVPVSRQAAPAAPDAGQRAVLQGLEAESRQKLWRWLVAAALAVLLLETLLAGRALRRTADAGGGIPS